MGSTVKRDREPRPAAGHVPDVVGESEDTAPPRPRVGRAVPGGEGGRLGRAARAVVDQDPAAGEQVDEGTRCTIGCRSGPRVS